MAYTLGALHAGVSGSGSMVVASPGGLLLRLTTIPAGVDQSFSTPPRLFNAGHVTLGDENGWLPPVPVTTAEQLWLPLPIAATRLGFHMTGGVVLVVRELELAAVDGASHMPYDRNPTIWSASAAPNLAGGTANTVAFSYTVPASRILMLGAANVRMVRVTAATTISYPIAQIEVNGVALVQCVNMSNVVGTTVQDAMSAGPLYLPAGAVVTGRYSSADTGGNNYVNLQAAGLTFDVA